jgi:hypothetical protein
MLAVTQHKTREFTSTTGNPEFKGQGKIQFLKWLTMAETKQSAKLW